MLSDNIRNYRKLKNMSQDELAERLNVSRQSISLWENGQTQPTIENIIMMSRIFGVTTDELLSSDIVTPEVESNKAPENKKDKKNNLPIIIVIIVAALIICALVLYIFLSKGKTVKTSGEAVSSQTVSLQTVSVISKANTVSKKTVSKKTETVSKKVTASVMPVQSTAPKKFDLFEYCKNFAIQIGELNGDYTMYQQSASNYGGNFGEFFSISYWGDSDMVEFCLHCPLSETQSINFYLRMRGKYDGVYEYLSSRYYRDDGTGIRNASGYIDPAVFSDHYPLNCTMYNGSGGVEKQNAFMEESRVGMCDLIKCLKEFVEVENMECSFDAFGFVNF